MRAQLGSASHRFVVIVVVLATAVACWHTGAPPEDPPLATARLPLPPEEPPGQLPEPAPPADGGLAISLSPCETAGCKLVFRFSLPMVAPDRLADAETPHVVFAPAQDGALTWRTPHELVFTPAAGALSWGQQITVGIASAAPLAGEESALARPWRHTFRIPYLRIAGKVASWPVIPGRPRLVAMLNNRSRQIGAGPLALLYDQPVDPADLAHEITVSNPAGTVLAADVSRPASAAALAAKGVDPAYVVLVSVIDLPADGESVRVSYPVWTSGDTPSTTHRMLEVDTRFKVLAVRSPGLRAGDRVPLQAAWIVEFDNEVSTRALEQALAVTPEPVSAQLSRHGWGRARVALELEPGTSYHMTFSGDLRDVLGNHLAEPVDLTFHAQDVAPFLAAPRVPLVVEQDRSRVPIRSRNVGAVEARVRRFSSPELFTQTLTGKRQPACAGHPGIVDADVQSLPFTDDRLNVESTRDVDLAGISGLLCLEVTAEGRGSEARGQLRSTVLVQSTDLAVTSKVFEGSVFVWLTRLSDASPVVRATVRLLDGGGRQISQGMTTASGTVELPAVGIASRTGLGQRLFVVAEAGDDAVVAPLSDDNLSHAWQFGIAGQAPDTGALDAVVFTERGVYRPGETVHVKVILGADAGEESTTPELRIMDPRGQQVVETALDLDRFSSADLDVELSEQAPVGRYSIRLTRGDRVTARSFRVEEYRVPTFRVTLSGDREWRRDRLVRLEVGAEYLRGGPLDGREARWKVWRQPQLFTPRGFPKYVFSSTDDSTLERTVASGEQRLDGQGRLAISFRPEHPSSSGPMRYVAEASVTDIDRQAYAGRLSRVVHPASFYVGILPPTRKLIGAGESLQVPVVAVAPDGTPVAGVPVRARLERIDHHSSARMGAGADVQLLNHTVTVDSQQCLVKTGTTAASCVFDLPEAGLYRVRAWAVDRQHRSVMAAFQVAVSGDNPTAWPRFDQDRIDVIADRARYRPGDIARLVVQTPFESAHGLLTVERDRVLEHRLFEIDGDTPALEVAILPDHAPNVFVSVVVVRGRVHDLRDASGFETGAPGFKIGYAELTVEPEDRRFAVAVSTGQPTATPGETVHVTLDVRDATGAARSGQATVMAVDEAVLGLTSYRTPDPVAQLYAARPLGVRTGASRHELPHARRSRQEQIFPAGDGSSDGFGLSDFPDELRKLFESTAYWNPDVAVGEDGRASVEIALPDNTTTYRIMAVVVGDGGRVGAADDSIKVRKPLMVQPVIPRFAYADDQMQVEAVVYNGTTEAGEVELAAEFDGLTDAGEAGTRRVTLDPGGHHSFAFPVRVTGREQATVRFAARLGAFTDGVEVTVPVLDAGSRRTEVVSTLVRASDQVALTLPADRLPGTTHVEVVASTTALSELKDAVQYLIRYPNGCIEQTTSTAYPLLVLRDLLPQIGVEVDEADLKKFSEAGVRRILSFQTSSGGLSYWPGGSQPHAFATAFGLTALIEGKKRGYDVPEEALEGMADYLESALRRGEISGEMPHGGMADGDTRALFVMTLGRLGRPQPAYVSSLWRERVQLTPFGLSFLAIAAQEMPGDQSLLQPILAEVRRAAREETGEAWFEGSRKGGWSFDSPLRTHASALLAYASSEGSGEMTGKLLSGLLSRRRGGMWGNTQENVFGMMGVHRASVSGDGDQAPRIELAVNGAAVPMSTMERVSERVLRRSLTGAELGLQSGTQETVRATLSCGGGPPVYLTVRARYEVPLTDNTRRATADGFTISRSYETIDGDSLEGRPIPLGALVRVRLRVVTDTHRNYVAIDDKLPAGLEPLNTSLDTTENVDRGQLDDAAQRAMSVLSYSEIRDSRVAFYADDMLPAAYEFSYIARATTPGHFLRPAGRAEAMYEPEVAGTTVIDSVRVE